MGGASATPRAAALPGDAVTVGFQNLSLQIEPVRWRATLAGCNAMVHQYLDGTLSLTRAPHGLGRYTAQGTTSEEHKPPAPRAVEKTRGGKVRKPTFPPTLGNPANPVGFPLSRSPACCWLT